LRGHAGTNEEPMSDSDPMLRRLADQIKALRREWDADPTEEVGREILAVQDAEWALYIEMVRDDLEKAKSGTAEARAAVQEARQGLSDARRALRRGEGPVEAVITAEDASREAHQRLRNATVTEEIFRAKL